MGRYNPLYGTYRTVCGRSREEATFPNQSGSGESACNFLSEDPRANECRRGNGDDRGKTPAANAGVRAVGGRGEATASTEGGGGLGVRIFLGVSSNDPRTSNGVARAMIGGGRRRMREYGRGSRRGIESAVGGDEDPRTNDASFLVRGDDRGRPARIQELRQARR